MRDLSLTAKTLSRWLRRAGTLPRGAVTEVRIELEVETTTSNLVFLTVAYSAEVPGDLPRSLVVKSPLVSPTPRVSPTLSDRSSEAQFYHNLASTIGTPPLVRCLAAIEDSDTTEDSDAGTIVLEDLRATHDHPPWPLPPSRTHCELAIDALVSVHAQWWEAPVLGHAVGKLHTTESLTRMVQDIAAHLPAFMDAIGDSLTIGDREIYDESSAHH